MLLSMFYPFFDENRNCNNNLYYEIQQLHKVCYPTKYQRKPDYLEWLIFIQSYYNKL